MKDGKLWRGSVAVAVRRKEPKWMDGWMDGYNAAGRERRERGTTGLRQSEDSLSNDVRCDACR